jgi:hypothetical protein
LRHAQSSVPNTRGEIGVGFCASDIRRRWRNSVSPLTPRPSRYAVRAPASPPRASASQRKAWSIRSVRRA